MPRTGKQESKSTKREQKDARVYTGEEIKEKNERDEPLDDTVTTQRNVPIKKKKTKN